MSLLSAAGMVFIAIATVFSWRTLTRLPYRWFCVGAVLWLLAVLAKQAMFPLDELIYPRWVKLVPPAVLSGALYVGLQCAFFEIGVVSIPILKCCYANWSPSKVSSIPNHSDVVSVN